MAAKLFWARLKSLVSKRKAKSLKKYRSLRLRRKTRNIAQQLYRNRLRSGRNATPADDWNEAHRIARNPLRKSLYGARQGTVRIASTIIPPWTMERLAKKTTWEWFELLLVPVLLAIGTFYLENQAETRQQRLADGRAEQELEIANDRAKQEILTLYLEEMKELLLDRQLRESSTDSEVKSVARALTTTTIKELSGERNGLVIDFLRESNLMSSPEDESPAQNSSDILSIPLLLKLDLRDADLSNTDLSSADLTQTDLRGADLSGAFLQEANLSEANLREANLSEAFLQEANLSEAFLQEANLSGALLRGANLSGADLSGADLSETNLVAAQLSGASLSSAELRGADLVGASLLVASLKGTDLSRTDLSGADLSGVNLSGVNLSEADLSEAFLVRANLSSSDLSGADLRGADLRRAQLSGASLSGADLRGADLTDTKGLSEEEIADFKDRGAIFEDQ